MWRANCAQRAAVRLVAAKVLLPPTFARVGRAWHDACVLAGVRAIAPDAVESGAMEVVRWLLALFQCCFYVSCSRWRRPWWLLVMAFLTDCHCRRMASCRALSAAAALLLALDGAALPGFWHAVNLMAALVAPLFPPKKSKRGSHLKRESRQSAGAGAQGETSSERAVAAQESGPLL